MYLIQWRSQEIYMWARLKGLECKGIQGSQEVVRVAKPSGRWRIFEKKTKIRTKNKKINEFNERRFQYYLVIKGSG